jgi:hypothetical protein
MRFLDQTTTASCGTPATTLTADGMPCDTLTNPIDLFGTHYQVDPVDPSGGVCEYDGMADKTKITSTKGKVCAPPSSCLGAVCGSDVCVEATGDMPCPAGFPAKTLVGPSASAQCSACGGTCTVAGTCTGTLAMFTDQACTAGEIDFPADGTCNKSPAPTNTGYYFSYSYTGSVGTSSCAGTPPTSTATVTLDSPMTVCCQN